MVADNIIYDSGPLIPFSNAFCICTHKKGQHALRGTGKCDNCHCSEYRLDRSLTHAKALELQGEMCVKPSGTADPGHTNDSESAAANRGAADTPKSLRTEILEEANSLVTGDRNNSYGEPHQDFARTAGALTALGFRGPNGRDIQAHDVAIIIGVVKMSRLMWSPLKKDSWTDLAGYAACGYEAAVKTIGNEAKETG